MHACFRRAKHGTPPTLLSLGDEKKQRRNQLSSTEKKERFLPLFESHSKKMKRVEV